MPGSVFKIVVDSGDWGSPMTNEATAALREVFASHAVH
jgi:hypothetical protein